MKKFSFLLMAFILFAVPALHAGGPNGPTSAPTDEGMWLPLLLKDKSYAQMKKMGLKLSADEIYSTEKPSIKDAIVRLGGGFCTAEAVSPKGLLLTNHHCAYDAIQTHSSVDHDYLTDGFWAKSLDQELPNEGLTASFLVRIEDVSARILDKIKDIKDPGAREEALQAEIAVITDDATKDTHYGATVEEMFYGNEYYLFVYETFRDVRLVGAPPSSIGKFGGDTDNWMWPRHTGDFAMFRVYAGPDGKPADYSPENIPMKPKHFLPISLAGINEGDFTMIMGYPGSTDRYLTSYALMQKMKFDNPDLIDLMDIKLKIMKEKMDASDAVRIALASKYASLSNSYKYYVGQNLGLQKSTIFTEREELQKQFQTWVNQSPERKAMYGNVLEQIKKNEESAREISQFNNYMNFGYLAPEFAIFGINFFRLNRMMQMAPDNQAVWQGQLDEIAAEMEGYFKDYDAATDEKIFANLPFKASQDLPEKYQPGIFDEIESKYGKGKEGFTKYAAEIRKNSFLMDKDKMEAFLENPSQAKLENDPGVAYVLSVIDLYVQGLLPGVQAYSDTDKELMRLYVQGLREMQEDKFFYPNANSTMRLTYGKVISYRPMDGVHYDYFTTHEGILAKEVPGDEEFDVHPRLKQLLTAEDFGVYINPGYPGKVLKQKGISSEQDPSKDKLFVGFLTDNDITGGNSGSPVMNAEGELIGIAFDGNWESMTSDLVVEKEVARTIAVDIRYVLFVIDKFAGAKNLIDEMTIVK